MADAYITETILKSYMGTAVVDALIASTGINLTTQIAGGTSFIQTQLANSGISTPTSTTHPTVQMAVVAAVWQMLASNPENNLALPEDWEKHVCWLALHGIVKGTVPIDGGGHSHSTVGSVGGIVASSATATVADGGRPPVATRSNLAGY